MPRLSRLIAPAIEQLYERTLVDFHLLQRMAFNSGNNAGHKPVLETKFNHGYERAILIEGGEAFAHVVRFTHRAKLHRSISAASMMAHPRRLPHSILIGPSTAAKFGGREESAGLSNYKPVVCVDLFGVGDTPQLLDLGRTGDGASDR